MSEEPSQLVLDPANYSFIQESRSFLYKEYPTKRLFDICFSSLVLLLGLPFFLLIGIIVGLTSRGRIIYSHERIGRYGTPFRCYKFRTMFPQADQRLKELLAKDPDLKEEWEKNRKLKKDPRITPFGRFLRKSSLDELPQFWNVLKGDLSVVGPRPVVRAEVERFFGARAPLILAARPGLTGLWQISGRSNTTYEQRLGLDEEYIQKQSIRLDLEIILKTIPAMTRGAY